MTDSSAVACAWVGNDHLNMAGRGHGCKNLGYLLLEARRMGVTKPLKCGSLRIRVQSRYI
jgi:hypothetical protein